MFLEGKVKSYITDRGFGFIQVDGESKDLFFHIHDFPNKNFVPKIGERLKFLIVEDNGKLKADQIVRLDLKQSNFDDQANIATHFHFQQNASPRFNKNGRKGHIFSILGLIVIAVLAVKVYGKYQDYRQARQQKTEQLMQQQAKIVTQQRQALGDLPDHIISEQGKRNLEDHIYLTNKPRSEKVSASIDQQNAVQHQQASQFKCDGRTHCSQMRSYDEAVFFLRNCPNTEMDGDNDGEPCERQFGR